jgi:hypothetical protein
METPGPEEPVIAPMPGDDSPSTSISPGDLQQTYTRDAYAAWLAARGDRHMPSRADMSPRVMRKFLNYVALVEVLNGGEDFRFRVVGDGIATQQKLPLAGKTMADVDRMVPGFGGFLKGIYTRTLKHRDERAYRGTYMRTADRHPFNYETLVLPLSDDGETVDHILVISV